MAFLVFALLSGLVFGFGLLISGMTNPAKIIGFLDLFGSWDPTLIFVMGGAVLFTMPAFYLLKQRKTTLLNHSFSWVSTHGITKRLLIGNLLFGIGWGLAGFCPGPGIVAIGSGAVEALLFAGSMLAGMVIFYFYNKIVSQ